jgi:two-component system, cell cycle sensor histidine kinase and response regulator CckA
MQQSALESAKLKVDAGPESQPLEILLVTPDEDLRAAGERALVRQGYHVRVASHSGHAVLASRAGRVDVLVAELSAPDVSGPALAQLLRKHHPALRVVFMANPGTPEGLEHVVVRPFTRDDLLQKIAATSLRAF